MGQDGVLCRSGWRGAHHVMRKAHCIWIPAWEYFLSSPSFAIKFIVSALRSVQTVSRPIIYSFNYTFLLKTYFLNYNGSVTLHYVKPPYTKLTWLPKT